jgi:hypothetical protein
LWRWRWAPDGGEEDEEVSVIEVGMVMGTWKRWMRARGDRFTGRKTYCT